MSYPSDPADGLPEGDAYDEDGAGRRLLRRILVILVMSAFAGGLWYAYSHVRSRSPGDVPLIRADITATKTRPEQPGGMAIPDQDKLIYNQGRGQPQVEKLLLAPLPETPLPRPVAAADPAPASSPAEAAAPTVSPVVQPPAIAVAPPVPAPPVTAPPAAASAVAAAAPHTPPPAPKPPAVAAVGGGFRLQLAALRSEDAAKKEWDRIKQANKDLLGAYGAAWQRVDLGDRGVFYRVQAGPVSDGAAAERICSELKRRSVGCILVRP
jgi:cell division septation protein DedD